MTTSHTLTYAASVDPTPGTILGPGLDGRHWEVTGSYPCANGTTHVEVQHVTPEELAERAAMRKNA